MSSDRDYILGSNSANRIKEKSITKNVYSAFESAMLLETAKLAVLVNVHILIENQ